LNKTLLSTNSALTNLTASITNLSKSTATGGMGSKSSGAGGGGGSAGGSAGGGGGSAGGSAGGGGGSSAAMSSGQSSKKAPAVGSAPAISFPSMGSSGSDGGADGKTGTGSTDMPKKSKGSSVSLDEKAVKDMIIRHEGKVNKPYKDSLGLWTVGVGHLIGDGKSLPDSWNREFSDAEVMKMFDEDYNHHRKAAEGIPGFDKFNSAGQGALTDLTFNMGPSWYKRFPNTAKKIEAGNAEGAAEGLRDSKWYGQVGKRAPTITGLISQGGLQAKDGGLADGPMEGYPATLHGNEAILPLNPDSVITKLLNTSEAQLKSEMNNNTTNNTSTQDDSTQIMADLYTMMEEKFDAMIGALEDGNSQTEKLVKFSAV
jgi:GH24 family phage-related lysozyme (muramidase)